MCKIPGPSGKKNFSKYYYQVNFKEFKNDYILMRDSITENPLLVIYSLLKNQVDNITPTQIKISKNASTFISQSWREDYIYS